MGKRHLIVMALVGLTAGMAAEPAEEKLPPIDMPIVPDIWNKPSVEAKQKTNLSIDISKKGRYRILGPDGSGERFLDEAQFREAIRAFRLRFDVQEVALVSRDGVTEESSKPIRKILDEEKLHRVLLIRKPYTPRRQVERKIQDNGVERPPEELDRE